MSNNLFSKYSWMRIKSLFVNIESNVIAITKGFRKIKNKIINKFILRIVSVNPKHKIKGFEYIKKY